MRKIIHGLFLIGMAATLLASCQKSEEKTLGETKEEAALRLLKKEITPFGGANKITFLDAYGKTIKTSSTSTKISFDGDMPTKAADEKYSYIFSGWDLTYDNGDTMVAKPKFESSLNSYEVRFYDGDELVSMQNLFYGEMPEAPLDYEPSETIKPVYGNVSYHKKIKGIEEVATQGLIYQLLEGRDEWAVSNYVGESLDVVIPSSYRGLPVSTIEKDCFSSSPEIKSIYIPLTVKNIEVNAFRGINSLNSIILQEGNGKYKLDSSGSLYYEETFEYWDGPKTYRYLLYCPSGKQDLLDISEDYFQIEDGALNKTNATIIKLSTKGVFSMEDVFGGDYDNSVKQVIITSGYLRENCFKGMENLYSVTINGKPTIPDDATDEEKDAIDNKFGEEVGESCFEGCLNLRSVSLPSHIKKIEKAAFKGCESLEDVILGFGDLSINSVGAEAFDGCQKIKGNEKEGIIYLGNFDHKYQLPLMVTERMSDTITISEDTLAIPDGLFKNNKMLKDVDFENALSLKSIGEKAFFGCSNLDLYSEKHVLPMTIEEVGYKAFTSTDYNSSDTAWLYADVNGDKCEYCLVNLKSDTSLQLGHYTKFIDGYGIRNGFANVSLAEEGNDYFTIYGSGKILTRGYHMVRASNSMTAISSSDFGGTSKYLSHFDPFCFYRLSMTDCIYFQSSVGYGPAQNVSSIGEYALANNRFGEKMYFGDYIQSIGDYGLYYANTGNVTLDIPESLLSVGAHVFESTSRFTLKFKGSEIPKTWDPNFDGYNGASSRNTYTFDA